MSDLISRQDEIEIFDERRKELTGIYGDLGGAMSGVVKIIKEMPPVYTDEQIQKIQDMEQAALEKAYECGRQDALSSESDVARDIATIIENEQDMRVMLREPKWIPCSERLPEVMSGTNGECSDDVLICVADDEQITISTGFYGYYPREKSFQGWWNVWAYGCNQLDSECKVVAWMPLPEPYSEEVERGEEEER